MSGYIMWLRSFVGHQPLLQCGTGVIVENEKGEILLIKRTDNGCWGYPGGSIELGERVEDAAVREVYEETGIEVLSLELFSVFSGEDTHYTYPNGDEVHNIDIVYICKEFKGELKPDNDEACEALFFDIYNLPENISPPLVYPLKKYVEMRKNSACNT